MGLKINPVTGKLDLYPGSNDDLTVRTLGAGGSGNSEFYTEVLLTTLPSKDFLATDSTGQIIEGVASFRGVLSAAPTSPLEGWTYINSVNHTYYVYYGSSWQALHVLTPGALSFMLMETGDTLLLENGDKLALES